MALKAILESLEGIPEDVKKEYKKGSDGKYHLDVEGHEDIEGLKRKNQELLDEKRKEKEKREAAEAAAEQAKQEKAKKEGDVATLEAGWNKKFGDLQASTDTYKNLVTQLTSGEMANKIAADIAMDVDCIPLLLPHISPRMTTEIIDGKPTVKVLDLQGKPSAVTVEDLKKEFIADKRFARLIKGSQASGGGQNPPNPIPPGGNSKKFSEYNGAELIQLNKTNPAEYERLKAEHYNSKT